jgi:hypothetical protein
MGYNIIEGSTIRFYTSQPFTSIDGTIVNPDVVTFSYEIQGQTPVTFTWTNPTGDPSNTIVNTDVGYFQADIQTAGNAGTWTWQWSGQPNGSGEDETNTSVVAEGTVIVSVASVA